MKYFTIGELTDSITAHKYNISNTPTLEHLNNLIALVENVLDPIRESLGCPVYVSSGYRSPELNRKVHGAATSQHCKGQAADIHLKNQNNLKIAKAALNTNFDQMILEHGSVRNPQWIHISYSTKPRRIILYCSNNGVYSRISEDKLKELIKNI